MSWSYSGDPSSSDLDEVRFYLQDTDTNDQLLTDEEVQFVIDSLANVYGSNLYAAAQCAERIAAKFAREVSISADGVVTGLNELQEKYETLAASLRAQAESNLGAGAEVFAGGTLWSDLPSQTVKPLSFAKRMHDNYRAGAQDPGSAPEFPEFLDR